ncbi:MAG: T9SS type A sorting domain-containing protein [Candidatus Kapaibacterium sp.]
MKQLYTFIFTFFLLAPFYSFAQDVNSEGREFYVVFPVNDTPELKVLDMAVFLTSRTDTWVSITRNDFSVEFNYEVKAGETFVFSLNYDSIKRNIEVKESEKILDKTLKISARDPISVFVFSDKSVSAEGYKAIPTEYWSDQYIHNCFYDFNEAREWGSGFSVIAKEDNTDIVINVRDGANGKEGYGETVSGRKHGDVIKVTLNEGEVYTVQGNGKTRGTFDLSGSHINSDKPVGVVSYHTRAMIPSTEVQTGRDYLIEMLPAINTWGKKYVSLELDRDKEKGDYFRVVASKNNTTLSVKWYTKQGSGDNKLISSSKNIILKSKGDWYEYNGDGANFPHNQESIRGVAVFEADKPILVNQYSYSSGYDSNDVYEPFMTTLPSIEQFVTSAIFATPSNIWFLDNTLVLFAEGDSSDTNRNLTLLNSILLDSNRIVDIYPDFLKNRIPTTNIYWVEVKISLGIHTIDAETKFGGHIYGGSGLNAYGWPVAINYKKINEPQSSINTNDIRNIFKAKIVSENPTSNNTLRINVTSKSMNKYNFSITNINGRVVKELGESVITGEKEIIYDISDLNSGVYFMNITDGSMNRILEFIVAR